MQEIPIQGIENLYKGIWLTNEGYNLNIIPEGFTEFHVAVDHYDTGLQAKFMRKDQTVYVLVAGTNGERQDIAYNWPTKGKTQFNALDGVLREVILEAKNKNYNIVVAGDSGGGLVAQHAYIKYGVDVFCTNTTGVWPIDEKIGKQARDSSFYYNPNGKMITVINDGEALSTKVGYPSYGEVYIIPSQAGAQYRYYKDELEWDKDKAVNAILTIGIAAHKDREYMLSYTKNGGKVYSPEMLKYGDYMANHPKLLPIGSYTTDPYIDIGENPVTGGNILSGRFGRNMTREEFAGMLGVNVKDVGRTMDGYFNIDLTKYPNADIQMGIKWFDFKKRAQFPSSDDKNMGVGGAEWNDPNFSLNQSVTRDYRKLDSSYFQLPEQRFQDMTNIAYLENRPFNFDDEFGYSDNIMLQIGNLQYKTESYSSNIA